jgi:hypothetical protein
MENDIRERGHNLFWNQRMDWNPKWVWLRLTSTSSNLPVLPEFAVLSTERLL